MKNFKIEMIPPVPGMKLGKDFKLNKDTAKKLYFVEDCNLKYDDKAVIQWYEENFDEETLMSWRCEYILKCIDETYKLINKDPNINEFKEVLSKVRFMLPLFVKDKKVLDKEIYLLIYLSNTLGDFQYTLSGEDHEYITIGGGLLEKEYRGKNYSGFLHNLMLLGYDDLIEKTIKKVVIPSIVSFPHETEYMKKMGLEYLILPFLDQTPNEVCLNLYLNYFKGTKFEQLLLEVKL